jgi:hypothetical protein
VSASRFGPGHPAILEDPRSCTHKLSRGTTFSSGFGLLGPTGPCQATRVCPNIYSRPGNLKWSNFGCPGNLEWCSFGRSVLEGGHTFFFPF